MSANINFGITKWFSCFFLTPSFHLEDIHDNLANSENYLQLKLVVLGKQVNVELRRERHKKKTDGKKTSIHSILIDTFDI